MQFLHAGQLILAVMQLCHIETVIEVLVLLVSYSRLLLSRLIFRLHRLKMLRIDNLWIKGCERPF